MLEKTLDGEAAVRDRIGRLDAEPEDDGGTAAAMRHLFRHVAAWLQAMLVAVLFGLALLVIGSAIALVVRAITAVLAWIAGAL